MGTWVSDLWEKPGAEALANTVAMSVDAIILAGVLSIILVSWALRTLATRTPLGMASAGGGIPELVGFLVRGLFVVTRAVPGYPYAFLLVGLMGPSALAAGFCAGAS